MASVIEQGEAHRQSRSSWLLAWLVPLLPLLGAAGYLTSATSIWLWIGPLVLYGVVPLVDHVLGDDAANPPDSAMAALADDVGYRLILLAWLPLHALSLLLGVYLYTRAGLQGWEALGWAMTLGLVAGGGINVAHELGHKRGQASGWLAMLALAPALYGHFLVEHNRGHHARVATPEDPASARLGESYWRFLPRTVVGGLRSAWRLERARLAARGLGVWHWRNHNLQAWSLSILLFGTLALMFGPACLPWLLLQAAFGIATLEAVNYIEHYGLLRGQDANGRYERCQPRHSWNSNRRLSNRLLFQLERHSDHHAHPLRPYQTLRHFEDSPQLPAGYATLVPLSWISPLWFRLMDPRVLAFYGGDAMRANRGRTQSSAVVETDPALE